MTTLITEVPGNLVPVTTDDAEARDRKKQWLEQEYHRRAMLVLEDLQRAGLVTGTSSGQVDVVVRENDSGPGLLVEMKFSPQPIEPETRRESAVVAAPALLSPDDAERYYQALGRFKGPLAAKDVQGAAREFWCGSGVAGARWLVQRLRDEFQIEVMHAAATALASIGASSFGPIFEGLSGNPPVDQAQVLLWALVSLAESEPSVHAESAQPEIVLVEFLQHDEPDLRESAARAMRLLRRDRALRWLSHRLRDESNAEVRRTIEDELAWHRTGRS
jgi:hypothetical protein